MAEQINAPRIFPTFRCRNASALIEWLTSTVGFEEHARFMSGDKVAHAELALGPSIIMLGDAPDEVDAYGEMVGPPGSPGGKSLFVAVEDPVALCERVRATASESSRSPLTATMAVVSSSAVTRRTTSGASAPTGRRRVAEGPPAALHSLCAAGDDCLPSPFH